MVQRQIFLMLFVQNIRREIALEEKQEIMLPLEYTHSVVIPKSSPISPFILQIPTRWFSAGSHFPLLGMLMQVSRKLLVTSKPKVEKSLAQEQLWYESLHWALRLLQTADTFFYLFKRRRQRPLNVNHYTIQYLEYRKIRNMQILNKDMKYMKLWVPQLTERRYLK